MMKTARGNVILSNSMEHISDIQDSRGKISRSKYNISSSILSLIDSKLTSYGFEWLHSGVGKANKSIMGIYYHSHTGYLFRASIEPSDYRFPIIFNLDSWADDRIHYSSGMDVINKKEPHRGIRRFVNGEDTSEIIRGIEEVHREALICYGTDNIRAKPV